MLQDIYKAPFEGNNYGKSKLYGKGKFYVYVRILHITEYRAVAALKVRGAFEVLGADTEFAQNAYDEYIADGHGLYLEQVTPLELARLKYKEMKDYP